MNNHFDEQWKELQQIRPNEDQKEAMKTRIRQSIQGQPTRKIQNRMEHWNSILSVCLLFLICGSFLWLLLQGRMDPNTADQPVFNFENFSWNLEDVYSEKAGVGWDLYRKNKPLQVGSVTEVTKDEMNKIINSSAMSVNEELKNFPYPTHMYIEHVKMMDVALRYHFFVPTTDERWVHFSFDYQQLEYAEIFQAMATLEIKGKKPYIHNEQLYVKHGYGSMIYPVGLKPINTSPNKETYYWAMSSYKPYYNYLEKIERSGEWEEKSANGNTNVFVTVDGNEEVTINFNGKDITYEFYYPNQEE